MRYERIAYIIQSESSYRGQLTEETVRKAMQGDEETDLRNNDESKDFFVAEEAAGRLEGDASAFCGRPFFSFGDIWDIIAPDIDNSIGRYLQLAKLYGNFRAAGSGPAACYLDYPGGDVPVRARMAVIDCGEDAQLETAYPVFDGYPACANIAARYDWDNGVCGFLSMTIPEGPSFDFFVPSYGLSRRQCVPGARIDIVVSGLALKLEKIRQRSFVVERGPLYEMQLERFLRENPGKSVADFQAPVVSLEKAVIGFPTGTTCWYSIIAPIREVAEVQFDGRIFYRILLPIGRTASEEDILAYIYAEKCGRDFAPATGDLVECLVWLCADPVSQAVIESCGDKGGYTHSS